MYLTGMVDKRTLEKYEREAKEKNRETWYLSWCMDTNQEGESLKCSKDLKTGHSNTTGTIRFLDTLSSCYQINGPSILIPEYMSKRFYAFRLPVRNLNDQSRTIRPLEFRTGNQMVVQNGSHN
jgi:hypothetical protein